MTPEQPVPLTERRKTLEMGLLWLTLVTGLPNILIGFEWHRSGISMPRLLFCVLLGGLAQLIYTAPACMLGARTGLSFVALSRRTYGHKGVLVLSVGLIVVYCVWYAICSLILTDALIALFALPFSKPLIAAFLCAFMALNVFTGFRGIASFATLVAGPLTVIWIAYGLARVLGVSHLGALTAQKGGPGLWQALPVVASFICGISSWGNEADYWRYAQPRWSATLLALLFALFIGIFVFPVTGWLLGEASHGGSASDAMGALTHFTLGGHKTVAALILVVTTFAVSDAILYAAIESARSNLQPHSYHRTAIFMTTGCVVATVLLSSIQRSLEVALSIGYVFLPTATSIVLAEELLRRRRPTGPLPEEPPAEWPTAWNVQALSALAAACLFGVLTSGLLPGLEAWRIGLPPLQVWLFGTLLYLVLRTAGRASPRVGGGPPDS